MNSPAPDKPFSKHPDPGFLFSGLVILLWCVLLAWACPVQAAVIKDQNNGVIEVEAPFKRIISLYGAHTENIYALGAQDRLIGVSINDKHPVQVNEKQRFSYHDGPEKYLAVQPDLVLIRPMIENGYPQFVRQLRAYGITVISLQPATISQMYDYWLTLGLLTGTPKVAEHLVGAFKTQVEDIQKLTSQIHPKKQVYFQAIHTRMRTFTPGAMPIFALETAGGINVAADAKASRNTNVAIYGKEKILEKADQIEVFIAQKGIMNPVNKSMIQNEPGFGILKAVKEDQVYLIDESIVSRPVPRLLQGIHTIGLYLYPELFSSIELEKDFL